MRKIIIDKDLATELEMETGDVTQRADELRCSKRFTSNAPSLVGWEVDKEFSTIEIVDNGTPLSIDEGFNVITNAEKRFPEGSSDVMVTVSFGKKA